MTIAALRPAPEISRSLRGYRDLLVHVEPYEGGARRLEVAIELATRWDAKLIGLAAGELTPWEMQDASILFEAQQVLVQDFNEAGALFASKTGGLKTGWRTIRRGPSEALADCACEADLIIMEGSRAAKGPSYRRADPGRTILSAGVPVLVVPESGSPLRAESITIAWKDTREARRAVRDALPLLTGARTVSLFQACREGELDQARSALQAVASHLARHGVKQVVQMAVVSLDPVVEILTHAASRKSDLIVLGGYGHSRLGEWVYGGVTAEILDSPSCYLLMSH